MSHLIVAGGGIAGLATAVALGRHGHRVDVFERRRELGESGAGLQLSPNATRVARDLGLMDDLIVGAVEIERLRIRRGRDGTDIAALPLGARARARYGAPFLVMHRADLHAALVKAATSLPQVTITLGSQVAGTDPESGAATTITAGAMATRRADGLVYGDGIHADRERTGGLVYSGKTAWRTLIPAADLPAAFVAPTSNLWLGERAHVVHYPLRRGSLVNVIVIIDEDRDFASPNSDLWAEPGDPAVLGARLKGWHADLLRLITAASAWRKWPLFDGGPRPHPNRGGTTQVGDAAHPMLPFLAQGASQSFEDAAALAAALADTDGVVPAAFQLYEYRRTARTHRVQVASRRQGRIYHLGGPAARARDLAMTLLGPQRLLAHMDWLYGDG